MNLSKAFGCQKCCSFSFLLFHKTGCTRTFARQLACRSAAKPYRRSENSVRARNQSTRITCPDTTCCYGHQAACKITLFLFIDKARRLFHLADNFFIPPKSSYSSSETASFRCKTGKDPFLYPAISSRNGGTSFKNATGKCRADADQRQADHCGAPQSQYSPGHAPAAAGIFSSSGIFNTVTYAGTTKGGVFHNIRAH